MSSLKRSVTLLLALTFCLALFGLPTSEGDTFRPVVRGRRGVVAGGHPLSVEAGLRILQADGNAVDAGVATILAASVIEFSHFSFGGEAPILIKLRNPASVRGAARRDGIVVIEGMGTAPRKATLEFFLGRAKQPATKTDGQSQSGSTAEAGMATMAGANPGLIPSTGPLAATGNFRWIVKFDPGGIAGY